jgi:hypothetical protein
MNIQIKLYLILFFLALILNIIFKEKQFEEKDIITLSIENKTDEPQNFEERYTIVKEFADSMYSRGKIVAKPELFANALLIITYCESGYDTTIKGSDGAKSTGLFQFTKRTREILNIEKNMNEYSFKEQIWLYERFIDATYPASIRCKTIEDFHIMNFAPSKVGKNVLSKVTNKHLKGLDMDGDSLITKNDFKLFQEKRCREQPELMQLF